MSRVYFNFDGTVVGFDSYTAAMPSIEEALSQGRIVSLVEFPACFEEEEVHVPVLADSIKALSDAPGEGKTPIEINWIHDDCGWFPESLIGYYNPNPEPEGTEHINKALAERLNNKEESQMTERELEFRNEVTKVIAYVNTGVLDEATAQGIYVQLVLQAMELRIDIPDVISTRLNPASLKCISKITGVPNAPESKPVAKQVYNMLNDMGIREADFSYDIIGKDFKDTAFGNGVSMDLLLPISEQHDLVIARTEYDEDRVHIDIANRGVHCMAVSLDRTNETYEAYTSILKQL